MLFLEKSQGDTQQYYCTVRMASANLTKLEPDNGELHGCGD